MEQEKKRMRILFALYLVLMLLLLFVRPQRSPELTYWASVKQNVNLKPLRTLRMYLRFLASPRPSLRRYGVINLAGNVLMFLPMGYCLPLTTDKLNRFWKVLLIVACTITLVEILQLLLRVGNCDIDDLILNCVGAAMGYGLLVLFRRYQNKKTCD